MLWFKPETPQIKKETIENINLLIEQLKEKKKEWKKFHPNQITGYNINIERFYTSMGARSPYSTPGHIRNEFDKIANKVKDMCIYSCSYFIAELKQSRRIISKVPDPYVTRELKKIALNLEKYYNDILTSELRKELQEEHRLEFKRALTKKKWMIEGDKAMANLDIEKLISEGMFSRKELNDPYARGLIQKVGKTLQSKFPTGWRGCTWRKDMLRRYNVFYVFIGDSTDRLNKIISSLTTV